MTRKPRIVVAGQVPPPMGGQNAMILDLLVKLGHFDSVETEHLPFHFTPDTQQARKGQVGKVAELIRVIMRLLAVRTRGTIDLLVYPTGGPQFVPLFRDLLLLPWILFATRRTVLHFHAAGLADALQGRTLLARCVAFLYRRCSCAIVMTKFNRRDPEACGIQHIHVVPHQLEDHHHSDFIDRGGHEIRILAMGHLCNDKGTPMLIASFGKLRSEFPNLKLMLAGEPLAPYSRDQLETDIKAAGAEGAVELLGVVSGEDKKRTFGRAHLFVFPSIAPYESFGLVLVEALMWGIPILASQWRGNADVLEGAQGSYLYDPPDSAEAFTRELRKLLGDLTDWQTLGATNRNAFLSSYSISSDRGGLPELLLKMINPSSAS